MAVDVEITFARRLIAVTWLTYFFFYVGRLNLSAALDPLAEAQDWSRGEVGILGTSMLWAYAVGQILAGQLGTRFSPRRIVAFGLAVTAAANLLMSAQSALAVMVGLAALNGVAQASGWGPMLRIVSERLGSVRSQGISILLSLSYQFGSAFSLAFAGAIIAAAGWRAGFAVPGLVLIVVLIGWMRWSDDVPPRPVGAWPSGSLGEDVRLLLPILAGALGMGFVFNGVLLWTPTYLRDTGALSDAAAATLAGVVPLLGAAGMIVVGIGLRRTHDPLRLMQVCLSLLVVSLLGAAATGGGVQVIWYAASAVALGGSVALLLGAVPLKLAAPGRAASAAGLVTAVQNIGGGVSGFAIGALTEHAGWPTVFLIWVSFALIGIVTTQFMIHRLATSITA
ncbi:MAG: MFS transporter [Chloroflexi bacterium]|nr:MFS transporter [Chloroflexota bacterium]